MKTTLRGWNLPYKELSSEKVSLAYLDGCNKTRYSRRKNQEGLLELASREAHEKKKTYYATILQEDDTPYCAIRADGGYFGIDFLRTDLENYLIYIYREPEESIGVNKNKLFLKGLFLLPKGKEYFDEINTMEISITPDGQWRGYIHKGSPGAWENTVTEYPPLSEKEIELLWVDYPKFGQYDELIRLDRMPHQVQEWVLRYTEQTHPHFHDHLQRDIEKYQKKELFAVPQKG